MSKRRSYDDMQMNLMNNKFRICSGQQDCDCCNNNAATDGNSTKNIRPHHLHLVPADLKIEGAEDAHLNSLNSFKRICLHEISEESVLESAENMHLDNLGNSGLDNLQELDFMTICFDQDNQVQPSCRHISFNDFDDSIIRLIFAYCDISSLMSLFGTLNKKLRNRMLSKNICSSLYIPCNTVASLISSVHWSCIIAEQDRKSVV